MPHRDQLSITAIPQEDTHVLTDIIGMRVCESGANMHPVSWTYLEQNSNYDNWRLYEVTSRHVTYTLKAENVQCIQMWAARKWPAGTRYSVVLVTRTEILDGVVLFQEKKPFLR